MSHETRSASANDTLVEGFEEAVAAPTQENGNASSADGETLVVTRTLGVSSASRSGKTRAAFTVRLDSWKLDVLATDRPIIVTIDGPAGTGKSTVARALAKRLGLDFLDTGAMYRAAAAIAIDEGIELAEHARIVDRVARADLHFDWTKDPPVMLASGKPIQKRLRDADVTRVVSPIAGIKPLRELMVRKQRIIGHQHPRLVSEGRDQGSVVFPDAAVKFYLDASPEVRGRRRYDQLVAAGQPADLDKLVMEIVDRDRSDSTRSDGPLICPKDAIVVDTSSLEFAEVVSLLEQEVYDRVGV